MYLKAHKRLICFLCALCLAFGLCAAALSNEAGDLNQYGSAHFTRTFSVYTGPGTNYYRTEFVNGWASYWWDYSGVAKVWGVENDWLMIGFGVNGGRTCVGYIPSSALSCADQVTGVLDQPLTWINQPATISSSGAPITDDPERDHEQFAYLKGGSGVTLLGYYKKWAYIEANITSRIPARGFINANYLVFSGGAPVTLSPTATTAPGAYARVTQAPDWAPVTQAPVTWAPVTQAPVTQAPVTWAPVTQAPVTWAPVTQAPVTWAPVTWAPVTWAPVTQAPVTQAPVTRAPITQAPVTWAPVTWAPITQAPVTWAPVTRAPITQAPVTWAPVVTATPYVWPTWAPPTQVPYPTWAPVVTPTPTPRAYPTWRPVTATPAPTAIPVTTSTLLSSLTHNCPNTGEMLPSDFSPYQNSYILTVASWVSRICFTPTAYDPNAYITVDGQYVASGRTSGYITISDTPRQVDIQVRSGYSVNTYTVYLQRRPGETDTQVHVGTISSIYQSGGKYYVTADLVTVNYYGEDYSTGSRSTYQNPYSTLSRYLVNANCDLWYGSTGAAVHADDIVSFMANYRTVWGSGMYYLVVIDDEVVAILPYEADTTVSYGTGGGYGTAAPTPTPTPTPVPARKNRLSN